MLQDINHSVNEAYAGLSSLANAPEEFANRFSSAVDMVANGVQAEPVSASEAVDNSRNAQALMLAQVKADAPSTHYNVQMVTGAVKMNRGLTMLEKAKAFDITEGVL